jgi:outer membrane protein assembly factor BamB
MFGDGDDALRLRRNRMSEFADLLADSLWYLQAAGGGYLAPSSDLDPHGDPYLSTAPTRASATQFAFDLVRDEGDNVVRAAIRDSRTRRYIDIGDDSDLVLYRPEDPSYLTLLVTRRRSAIVALSWDRHPGTQNAVFDASRNRFSESHTQPAVAILLAGDPPEPPVIWRSHHASAAIGSPASFGGHQVLAGSSPMLTCVDTLTGRLEWKFDPGLAATSPAVVNWVHRRVIVASGPTVFGVSIDTGAELWRFTASSGVYARPRALGEHVFVCASYGVLHALWAQEGQEHWRYPTNYSLEGLYATPAQRGGMLFLGAQNGAVYALDVATGARRWSANTGAAVNGVPLATDDAVFVGNDAGFMIALDPKTGDRKWITQVGGIVQSRPALQSARKAPPGQAADVLVAPYSRSVLALDAASGAQRWSIKSLNPVLADVGVSDAFAYVVTVAGELGVLSFEWLEPESIKYVKLGAPSAGSVHIMSGAVNVATTDGAQLSFSAALREDVRPQDLAMLLQASDIANGVSGTTVPPLPAQWTAVGAASTTTAGGYGLVFVATLRRPSDDAAVTLVAFGTDARAFLNAYDPASAALVPIPGEITGPTPRKELRATDSVLQNYMALRPSVRSLVGSMPGKTVLVTGFAQAGALAAICGLDLSLARPGNVPPAALRCVNFGSPAIGNADFDEFFRQYVWMLRVVTEGDATIDSLPSGPKQWEHLFQTQLSFGQGFPSPSAVGTVPLYTAAMAGLV